MPQYQKSTLEPIMDLLDEALLFNESDGFLKDPNGVEIHKVLVTHDIEKKYRVTVNEIEMGGSYNMGEAYRIIKDCTDSLEPTTLQGK